MLTLIPVSLAQANEFVRQHHRHHKPVAGHKFSIGCAENGRLCAVAIVGRPVSRYLDDGFTLEVNRLCSDGTKNACSILYAAAARAARAMGYHKIITYTLDTESGVSLRAAGWTNAGLAGGKAWTGSRRPAQPLYPAQMKYRYEKRLNERNKHFRSVFAALLCAVLCMTAFATVAYADGGDYYDDELPPETWQEEPQPEDTTIVPGTPFTEDGIAATRDLLYDKHTNKQFITVETRNGHTLYIVIDYDKLLDEEEERYQTYFLNPVDEADLMALLEDDSQNTPVVCSCTEKCTAGKVNTNCALCKTDMTNCAGKEATPEETEQSDEPTPEKKNNVGGILILVLILAAGGGGALWYFKLRKPKSSVKGGDELDEFDFDEDDEAEEYGDYEDADSASDPDEQENEE